MHISKTYFLPAFCLMLLSLPLAGQVMRPGDVNDNGEANAIDVLFIGQAYGSTGPIRPGANTNWGAQDISTNLWGLTFGNGLDYAYADCNGDGIIDMDDIEQGVENNFLKQHGMPVADVFTADGVAGVAPSFMATADKELLFGLDTLLVELDLGSSSIPVEEFYGIAFTVFFDKTKVKNNEAKYFLPDDPWYDPLGGQSETLVVENESMGRIDVAITRIDQEGVDGFGSLGRLSFVIIEDVVGESVTFDSLVEIRNIKVIDKAWNDVQVFDTLSAMTTSVKQVQTPQWHLYPNPAKEWVQVELGDMQVQLITISNALGQEVKRHYPSPGENSITVSVRDLPGGAYYLTAHSVSGRWSKKLIIPCY